MRKNSMTWKAPKVMTHWLKSLSIIGSATISKTPLTKILTYKTWLCLGFTDQPPKLTGFLSSIILTIWWRWMSWDSILFHFPKGSSTPTQTSNTRLILGERSTKSKVSKKQTLMVSMRSILLRSNLTKMTCIQYAGTKLTRLLRSYLS